MNKTKPITRNTFIADIVELYPLVVDFLVEEYNFFCLNCFMSEFETIEEGCRVHGIIDKDFEELLNESNKIAIHHVSN